MQSGRAHLQQSDDIVGLLEDRPGDGLGPLGPVFQHLIDMAWIGHQALHFLAHGPEFRYRQIGQALLEV